MPGLDESRDFIALNIAVMTVSDTRTLDDDTSGQTLVDRLEKAGHRLADRAIVKDDIAQIRATVSSWIADDGVDVVLTTGGTGLTGRDVTPDALMPLFDKVIDGFSTVFNMISYEKIGLSTIQSRACAGVAAGTYIFCVPGSTGACKDAWDGILVHQFDYRYMPCNFVEIMPRLEEHKQRKKG